MLISLFLSSEFSLDDIEDDSTLRRGSPAVHVIYGTAQSINSANYMMVMALSELQKLRSPKATTIFIGKSRHYLTLHHLLRKRTRSETNSVHYR